MDPSSPKRNSLAITLVVLVVLALVVAALYFVLVDPYQSRLIQFRVGNYLSAKHLPADISDASYLLSPLNGGGIYEKGNLWYPDYVHNGSLVIDIARGGGTEAKLLFNPTTKSYDTVVNGKVVHSSQGTSKFLFVSPDGSRVSVTEKKSNGLVAFPDAWDSVVIDISSGTTWEVPAFAAPFLAKDTVLAFESSGIIAFNFETNTQTPVLATPIAVAYSAVTENKDGSSIAWVNEKGVASVYRVESDRSALTFVAGVNDITGPIALTDNNLYELAPRKGGGTNVLEHSLSSPDQAPTLIRSFPTVLALAKLIP
jgi:hypothetical protein